jgi:FixJ family two-component response regulator
VTGPSDRQRWSGPHSVRTVAVVDDDPSIRRGLDRLLRSVGLSVVTFASAEQFLALCRLEMVSCVVLDVHLGGMSGLELLGRLATAENMPPVILITAYDDPETTSAIERSGAAWHLRKPFDDVALIGAITDAVGRRR